MANQYLSQVQTQKMSQVLAPQLRQSLELLQVPMLELRALIELEIQQNPTIEEEPTENEQLEIEPGKVDESEEDSQDKVEEMEFKEGDFSKEFEILAQLDDDYRDNNRQSAPSKSSKDEDERRQYLMDSLSTEESLQQHLINQLQFAELEHVEYQIGELLIGSIDDDGRLTTSLEELAMSTGFELGQLRRILFMIQEFEPIGVGARDIRECLFIQLRRMGMEESLEARVVVDHFRELGTKKYQQIARALKVSIEEVQRIAEFIATLDPRPGREYTSDATTYVLPEIIINRVNGELAIQANDDQLPHLHISNHYRKLMEDKSTSTEVRSYIREKIRAGTFLIKSIGQRQSTIRNIAQEIIKVQGDFFEHGVSHLKPLTMAEVAVVLDIHETTVSRAIASKYMETPQGVFQMKYFFTPGFTNADGKSVSNKTIKDRIAQLVAAEDQATPLSDQAMVKTLAEEGTKVARRTIAKYRDELHILPSHLRKSF